MGTDITMFLEEKQIDNEPYETIAQLFIDRNYKLFAIISDVQNAADIECVSHSKGLPDNLGIFTCDYDDEGEIGGHSSSWLNLDEIKKAIVIAEKLAEKDSFAQREKKCCLLELQLIERFMSGLREPRIVFWFNS